MKEKHLIEKIWPLPPVEKRRLWPFLMVPKHIKKGIRTERDGDYLCYQAGALVEKLSFLVLILTLLDFFGHRGIILDFSLLEENKAAFIYSWGRIVGPATLLINLVYYLRARLPMDIENDMIPFFVAKKFLRGKSRRDWLWSTGVLSFIMLIVVPFAVQIIPSEDNFFDKFNVRSDMRTVFVLQFLFAFGIGIATSFGLSCGLIYIKSKRYFDRAQEDMENW